MKICVYCASSPLASETLKNQAVIIGEFIAKNGHTLVYGGATGGLMDAVAQAASDNGGEIIGIIPQLIIENGRKSDLPTQLFVVKDMNERKAMLKEISDIFVVLPGGFGTLDEFYDTITSGVLGYFDKKIYLVNYENFYEGVILLIKNMIKENLGYCNRKNNLVITESAEDTVEKINNIYDL
ncbi:MAG: TIGR00730 family Rossman fold protein [Prevotellaceae bacterium]|jgi:uncharacterized protein (TIGR00730 family)|nr:TIGR00730 family Rossman fold protein [Prevotellaceae bacterium]